MSNHLLLLVGKKKKGDLIGTGSKRSISLFLSTGLKKNSCVRNSIFFLILNYDFVHSWLTCILLKTFVIIWKRNSKMAFYQNNKLWALIDHLGNPIPIVSWKGFAIFHFQGQQCYVGKEYVQTDKARLNIWESWASSKRSVSLCLLTSGKIHPLPTKSAMNSDHSKEKWYFHGCQFNDQDVYLLLADLLKVIIFCHWIKRDHNFIPIVD